MKKSVEWFNKNVKENEAELKEIGELANKALFDKISIGLENPEFPIAIYAAIFDAVTDVIQQRETSDSSFNINIANRFEIGYTTTDNEDDEKQGNFMAYIRPLQNTKTDNNLDEDETDTVVLCTQWNAANIIEDIGVIKDIETVAKTKLSDLIDAKIQSLEVIIPMFCIIHEQIVSYIKLKRVELNRDDYEINVAGLYTIGCQKTDDGEEEIYYIPSISLKLKLKNDAKASGAVEQ